MEKGCRITDPGAQPFGIRGILFKNNIGIDGVAAVELLKLTILQLAKMNKPFPETIRIDEFGHPDTDPRSLVSIAGADASQGGADLSISTGALFRLIQRAVIGQHDMGAVTDENILFMIETHLQESVELGDEGAGVYNNSIADHAGRILLENSGGDQMEDVLLVLYLYGMPRVGSALVTNNDVCISRQNIYDLTLALISPLKSYHTAVPGGPALIQTAHLYSLCRPHRRPVPPSDSSGTFPDLGYRWQGLGASDHPRKIIEKEREIIRTGCRLRMKLHREQGKLPVIKTLEGLVIKIDEIRLHLVRFKGIRNHRVTVILHGDLDLAGPRIEYRMVAPVMTEPQLFRPASKGQPGQLVTKADTENRIFTDKRPYRLNGIGQPLRITGSI